MRIVLVANSAAPGRPGDPSAAAVGDLAAALERRGIDVAVVLPSEPAPDDGALRAALRLPTGWPGLRRHWRALGRATEAAVAAGADVVHAHSWYPAGLAAPSHIPLVLTTYGTDTGILRESRYARRLAEPIFARAAVLTAGSREAADVVQGLTGRPVSREHVQMMPVPTHEWPWTAGGGGALVVADLEPSARLELAIHTVAVLASCGHALPLTIVGDGPQRDVLIKVAGMHGVETLVRFVDTTSPETIMRYLGTADLMLHPGKGAVSTPWILGAVLAGVPVIACWDGGAAVELVPETGAGRLTLPSTEAISDAALGVLMDPARLELARLVGEAWRARVAPDHVAEVGERWYREALGV